MPCSGMKFMLKINFFVAVCITSNIRLLCCFVRNMRNSTIVILFFLIVFTPSVFAQLGGNASFEFLNLSVSARNTALGGIQTSMSLDSASVKDASQWLLHPAYSSSELSEHAALGYMPYYADVKYGTFSYVHNFNKYGVWGAGIQYLSYGRWESFDVAGLALGEFSAQDYALVINHSHQIGHYRVGGNVKIAVSQIAGYYATALLADIGGAFIHPTQDFNVSLLFSNIGVLLSDYTASSNSRLPSDVRLGMIFKPQHMPARFSLSVYRILRDTRAYYKFEPGEEPGIGSKIFRHLTFGSEILLSPNFHVRVGYNHLIKSTLQLQKVSGGTGLSFGFMIRARAFQLDFSRGYYHISGGFSHLSLTANLNQLIFRK